jgi:predicted CoA-binding protein
MPAVAVIGASADRRKFGNKAVRAYLHQGWTVHPVNPSAELVEGLRAVPSVRDLPGPVDRVLLYVPPQIGVELLPDIARLGSELWVNPGAESDELLDRAHELGLQPIEACAIVDVGESPSAYR